MARTMTKQQRFFWKHAGISWAPGVETKAQGRRRGAERLAKAEQFAEDNGYTFEWREDWEIGSHKNFYGKGSVYENREPDSCEVCRMVNSDGATVQSLGCIDDATSNYRRVIEAELALEEFATIECTKGEQQ